MADPSARVAHASPATTNGADLSPPPSDATQQLAISGVVLDRAQLLAAIRATMPNATGIAPIDNGAYYAVLMTPAAPAAPAAPTLSPVSSS